MSQEWKLIQKKKLNIAHIANIARMRLARMYVLTAFAFHLTGRDDNTVLSSYIGSL